MARRNFLFEIIWRRRKKVADWLDKGKGPWWLRPWLRTKQWKLRREVAVWPPPRRIKRHRFPNWLFQQGAYWFLPQPQRAKRKARWYAVWPPPRRAPTRLHRFPSWLVQQGAYWVSNVRLRRKQKRDRTFLPPLPRRAPTRQHRFPSWLVQQGAYWWRRKKKPIPQPILPPHRARRKVAGWLATLPPPVVTYVPPRRKHRQFATAAIKRAHHKLASWLDPGKGSWWLKPLSIKNRLRARGYAIWPLPRRAPTRSHRFPSWLIQQGAYWTHRRKPHMAAQWPSLIKRRHKVAAWIAHPVVTAYTPRRRRKRQFAIFPPPRGRFPHHRGAPWIPVVLPPPFVFTPRPRRHQRSWVTWKRPRRRPPKNIVWIAGTRYAGLDSVWWITAQSVTGLAASASIGISPNATYQTRLRSMYLAVSGGSAGMATAVVRDGPAAGGTIIFEADLYTAANSRDVLDFNGIDLRATAGNVLTVEFLTGTPNDVQEINAHGDYIAQGIPYGVDVKDL